MRQLLLFLGSTGYTGLAPVAPATVSTAVVALLLLGLGASVLTLWIVLLISLVISVPVASWMEWQYGKDPSICTIDELVGYLLPLALMFRPLAGPADWRLLGLAFLLFRLFDIAKPWPVNRLERLPGGWGIVADDLMAGAYAFVVLRIASLWGL